MIAALAQDAVMGLAPEAANHARHAQATAAFAAHAGTGYAAAGKHA